MEWHDISIKEWELWKNRVNYVIGSSTFDQAIFDKYTYVGFKDCDFDSYEDLMYLQNVVALCNNYPEIKSRIFDTKDKISEENVYQYVYLIAYANLFEHTQKTGLWEASASIVNSITTDNLIDYNLFDGVELPKLTEHHIFEILRYSPVSTMLTLVNRLSATQEIIMQLKECILNADETAFVSIAVQNRISFEPIIASCYSLILLSSSKESITLFENLKNDNICWGKAHIFTPIVKDEVFVKRLNTAIEQGEEAMTQYSLSFKQNETYDSLWTDIYVIITKTTLLTTACPNYELIKKFNRIVAQDDLLKRIQSEYDTLDKIDKIYQNNFVIPIMEEFKRKFIIDLPLPPSNGDKKDPHDFFSGHTLRHKNVMLELYRLLVDEGILQWDEDTCFSFVYRTCIDYKPSQESTARMLKPIVWNGEQRDLLAMIYFLFYGDSRLWKKCSLFFLDSHGKMMILPKGCVNMAKAPTEKMENILKNKSFRQ